MNILLWRAWSPQYSEPATISNMATQSIGGTCSQMLWHARALTKMGHSVQVLGASHVDVIDEGVDFVGASDRSDQERLIDVGRVRAPGVILLEGGFAAAEMLRARFAGAKIVHIGQNIDRYGHVAAFRASPFIDAYALVGPGQYADYCVRFPQLRAKFLLVRNIVPWQAMYREITPAPVDDTIAWIGSWNKKGLREWAETMARVLHEQESYTWRLYGSCHGAHVPVEMPAHLFAGLDIPRDRIVIKSLPLWQLSEEVKRARVVLVSLGNECGPTSTLDAHAIGRPVVSGNDMVYKYANPDGTGVRVTTARERYAALTNLLRQPHLCDALGVAGRQLIADEYTEDSLHTDLERMFAHLSATEALGDGSGFPPRSERQETLGYFSDRVRRKGRIWLQRVTG